MQNNLEAKRHTLAHLLAAAILKRFPDALPTIGPSIENGFYYDFEFKVAPTESDLKAIQKDMQKILPTWEIFKHIEVTPDEAKHIFQNNPYKLELIRELEEKREPITIYYSGPADQEFSIDKLKTTNYKIENGFLDLCRGGHVNEPSKEIESNSWELSKIAGAYWRGSEENTMLTRIYGLAFENKEELEEYKKMMEEAIKRDHRKLGKDLEIFTFDDDTGPGLPLWLPNGARLIEALEDLAKKTEAKYGYERVRTPHIAKENMYITSGHLPYYKDSMFPPMEYEGGKYYLKAMNCPHHHKIFGCRKRSYKELPLRLAEYGTCYRHEKSGELFGLMRVRSMQMNDAHIYTTEEQFSSEFKKVIDMYLYYFKLFGIEKYVMRLSLHSKEKLGKKYIDEPELWIKTEEMVRKCLIESKVPFVEAEDEAAFYGPKIDVEIWSAIGREFTLATNQVDFAVPARFGLTYTDKDGKEKTPICIHRAPLSTHERMIGFLIEHYAGSFPFWLAPEQVAIIPVKENHFEMANKINNELIEKGIRSRAYLNDEGFGKKIRKAKDLNVPYTIIIGDKDIEAKMVTLESRDKGSEGQIKLEDAIKIFEEKNKLI